MEMSFIVVCSLIDNEYAWLLFSQTVFCVLFLHVERVCKSFFKEHSDAYEYLICIMQRVHFQVRVGVFNCQQILTEISFVIEFGLAWHWWNSNDLGLTDMLLTSMNEENCCLYIIIQKIAPQAESGKFFQIWFFPQLIWGKNGGVQSMHMQVILGSLFARPGSAPTGGEKKRD